jgi:hypothetical protein
MPQVLERPATKPKQKLTLGASADLIWRLREDKRVLDAQVKSIEADITALTKDIFDQLDAQDTRKAEGKRASISVNFTDVANVKDWQAAIEFIGAGKRNDKKAFLHLVQHRISDPAYRELRALGVVIPGLEDFTKRSLSITSLAL